MKKLALKLEDLRVDTFTTAEEAAGRGTVEGHYGTTHTAEGFSCEPTCAYTCAGFVTYGPRYECVICGGGGA